MRKTREKQRPLSPQWPDHQLAQELKLISRILDDNPQTLELIVQDLSDRVDSGVGAPGLTAEQVLRCAVIKRPPDLRDRVVGSSGGVFLCAAAGYVRLSEMSGPWDCGK